MRGRIHIADAVKRDASLNRGLVSWWMALPDQQRGNVFRDLMGRNHGALISGPAWGGATGRPGGFGALFFDGTDDYVVNAAYSGEVGNPVTMSLWARPTGTSADQYVLYREEAGIAANMRVILLGFQDGFWNVFNGGYPTGTAADTQMTATAGVWQHVLYTSNGSTLQGYLNGVLQISVSANLDLSSGANTMRIGSPNGASNFYAGGLDDIRIWNRYSSASEAAAIYHDSRRGYPLTLNWVKSRVAFEQGAAPGGLSIPIAAYHYNHHLVA